MALSDYKITNAEVAEVHVQAAPNTLTGSAQENKAVFDEYSELIKDKHNGLIDEIAGQHGDEIREAVDEWLAEHPEVTTTVQDNSLTTAKYVDGSVTEPKIAERAVTPSKLDRAYSTTADLASVNENLTNELNVLDARMDEFASLPEGSTTADAELIDIRVGADGETYQTAGGAVRGQVAALKSDISDLPYIRLNIGEIKDNYYLNSNGNEVAQVGWSVSNFLKIGYNTTYYVPSATTSSAVFCWFYDENKEKIESFQTTVRGWNDLVAPSNAAFVRFSIETNYKSNFKYNSLLLIPYSDGAIIPNLIENNKMVSSYADEAYVGFYYSILGAVSSAANWALLPLYRVNEGDVFYMDYPFSQYLTCFDEDKQFVSAQIAPTNGEPVTYTIPNGVSFVGVNLLKARIGTYDIRLNDRPLGAKYKVSWLRSSIWENKSYISHGDSITWQDGEEYIQGAHIGEVAKGYQTVFAENVGLGRKVNWGKSGWSMAVVNGNGVVNAILQIAYYSQFDLCTIACGTNDFKLNVPLGSLGVIGDTVFDDTTFYGAYRKSVEYILSNSPTIRLVLMTPLQRDNSGYDVNYTNSAGHKLIDYVNAVKAVGEMYGLPVCDMYSNSGFTKKTLATYTMDGLHPNDVGYKRMGDYLTGFLNAVGN